MQVFRELAGYSLGRADIVRRAMGKKKHDVMEREREVFIHGALREDGTVEVPGCVRNGIDEHAATKLFDEMSSFASYAFAKSHAAPYALVAYQTAYLKRHHPQAFLAALMSNESGGKVAEYAAHCAKLGIRLLPPSVNAAGLKFTAEGDAIRFGLLAVKNLGGGFIGQILEERGQNGPFRSFYDFLKRMQGKDFNRRAAESLIKAGALDGLGGAPPNRREMMMALPPFLAELEDAARRNVEGQLGFFDVLPQARESVDPRPPAQAEFSHADLLAYEKETLGFYLSGHPLAHLEETAKRLRSAKTAQLLDPANETGMGPHKDNEEVRLLCVILSVKKKVVKNDATMAFLTVEDLYGQMEALVFPSTLDRYANLCSEGRAVLLTGRLSLQEDKEAKLLCSTIEDYSGEDSPAPDGANQNANGKNANGNASAPKNGAKKNGRRGVFLRFPAREDNRLRKAMQFLDIFLTEGPGNGLSLPVHFYFEDTKQYESQPGVDWNPALGKALERLLGPENVVANE